MSTIHPTKLYTVASEKLSKKIEEELEVETPPDAELIIAQHTGSGAIVNPIKS